MQTELFLGCPGPDRRVDGGWAPYPVLGFVLGGSPNARIDAVLREEKGYTYGIRASFRPRRRGGLFLVSGSVRADATVEALGLLLDILERGRDGFTAEEIRAGVDFIRKTAPGRYATADAVADEAATMALEGLTTEFTTANLLDLATVDAERLSAAYNRFVTATGPWSSSATPAATPTGCAAWAAATSPSSPPDDRLGTARGPPVPAGGRASSVRAAAPLRR